MIPIPPALIAFGYRLMAYAAIAVALYGAGRFHQMLIEERARDQMIIERWEEGDLHVQNYLKKIGELADARTVSARLGRLCDARRLRVPSPSPGAPAPDPADRRAHEEASPIDQLGDELLVVQGNRYQCEELIAVAKKQQYNAKRWWEIWK